MNKTMNGCYVRGRYVGVSLRAAYRNGIAVLIFFSTLAGWICSPQWSEKPRLPRPVKIERFYAVAMDDDVISSPGGIDMAGETVFISNNFQHRVHVFFLDRTNHTLQSVRVFGQKGQGPGDLNLPTGVSVWRDLIAVKNEGGFSLFTLEGAFRKKFRYFNMVSSFQYSDNVFYCCAPNPNQPWLMETLNDEGKSLVTFGKKTFPSLNYENKDRMSPAYIEHIYNSCELITEGQWVYLFNRVTGWFYQFARDGKLIREKDLTTAFGVEGERRIKLMKDQAVNGLKPRDSNIRSIYQVLYRVFYVPGKFILQTPFAVTKKSVESDDRRVKEDNVRWFLMVLNAETLKPEEYLVLEPGSGEWRWSEGLVRVRENGTWLYIAGEEGERFGLAEFRLF